MREPLIILCPGRSFSSVICAVIGQHPEAFGLPEVHLFATKTVGQMLDIDMPFLGVPGATSGLKRAVAELAFGAQTDETIEKTNAFLHERRDYSGTQMFREICRLAGDRVIVEKSPTNTRRHAADRILAGFPKAKFLHIARQPHATMRSQSKAFAKANKRLGLSSGNEMNWLKHHMVAMQVASQVPAEQYMYLKGEWFFEDPAFVLEQICVWLGLSADADSIAQMMKPEESPFACTGPEDAKYGNNVGFIENPHLRIGKIKIEDLANPLDWREPNEVYLDNETRALARVLGY
ncbi:MAG: sulfotransferase [Pseudomonadota bacterium]